jgi:ferrochelatase
MGRKIAVVLFNLGGPDSAKAVRPFLKNLFSDPAIIQAPGIVRWGLARLISRTRAPSVIKNYAMMDAGGGSPIMPETEKQAAALQTALAEHLSGDEVKTFIAMRYWHPFVEDVAKDVTDWGADEVVLLPLYPQFSTTTTGSSLKEWAKTYGKPTKTVCCYPFEDNLISAHIEQIMAAYEQAGKPDKPVLLMSAHGLPEKIVEAGDPYQWQCELMGGMLAARLPADWEVIGCYQSRVGPLKWIGPSTEDEIETAAKAGRHILVAPIAFVSEHIETLVELGEEYREIAEEAGAASYTRVEALGVNASFIQTLVTETLEALKMDEPIRSCAGGRLCPPGLAGCPHADIAQKAGQSMMPAGAN